MPKIVSESTSTGAGSKGSHPNVLKRNQACHQCRRRKLKCDAKRPCSTCVRSHAHAVNHAPAGVDVPILPDCTYDDAAEDTPGVQIEGPKSRYERLENRINELEALLHQKEHGGPLYDPDRETPGPSSRPSNSPANTKAPSSAITPDFGNLPAMDTSATSSIGMLFNNFQFGTSFDNLSSQARPAFDDRPQTVSPTSIGVSTSIPPAATSQDIIWAAWPPNLPSPDLVRHLVEAFFSFHPHANRLFHVPTFMTEVTLPPHHAKFPNVAILHAICALGSLYTGAVTSPPRPNLSEEPPDELFTQKYKVKHGRSDTFADLHTNYAKDLCDEQVSMGENLFEVLQARIILTWYYWAHARWVDVYLCIPMVLRLCVACGLSSCPPFHTIGKSTRPLSLLPRAETIIQDELRRNAFWLAYSAERLHGCGNGWALCLDDMDVSQLLPARADQFLQGSLFSPGDRQWAHSKDLFLVHPEEQTDSFVLYIKAVMLISQVKNFSLRFRTRHYTGDVATVTQDPSISCPTQNFEPRKTPAFVELDGFVAKFRSSFPRYWKDPIKRNSVDAHLYTACLIPHVASLLLHEPHAEIDHHGCTSARKILLAARGILDLIYELMSTSYDISLLDHFVSFSWFMAGRILVRFLESALLANGQEQIPPLTHEIHYIRVAIAKMGERSPLAFRYAKMLSDFIVAKCGETFATPVTALAPRSHPVLTPPSRTAMYYEALQGGMQYDPVFDNDMGFVS